MNDDKSNFEERIQFLESEVENLKRVQECTASLISSLDFDETLHIILRTARDTVGAKQGSILLYNSELTHLAIAYAVGLREETVKHTRIIPGEGIAGQVAQSGEPILVENIDEDPRYKERRTGSERSNAFACLPMNCHGKTLGVMNLSHPGEEIPFNQNSLPLLVALANQAAVAIAHSELHRSLVEKEKLEQQIETARSIQESFIAPQIYIQNEEFMFSARNVAARTVGGDLYDVVEAQEGCTAFFLGDVSGKGIPAALYMARLFSEVHHFIGLNPEPAAVLTALNNSLCKRPHRGMFVTMAYGLIIPKENRALICNAGHPSPIVKEKNGAVHILPPPKHPPLGLLADISFTSHEVQLHPGDLMLLHTDGVNEATNTSGDEFGTSRLEQAIRQFNGENDPVDFLIDQLESFTGNHPAHDDITMLSATRNA
ncbi:MAG: SpoIIE family protein phosphatase [Nitrospinaceae bacterium]|jgi:phosphoserine phosphatase RsbU/P|nr:SpoIIE family protein phosphatase [Nitrospinaceae bacterium]MBT3435499.1 SpoIIE family protein phosphatase [Nitrospinaceae bacterium]MBT3822869.1 SpoIIE family protein phosphatase [Nitrospinaceae bacterium]MBT4094599.1 SpoIIE family protein phosphatase [Nitrospinaceae bacterium]MBT4432341.1 SpoIIE family protein phosphatase [Nitrospinaceae bacterium]